MFRTFRSPLVVALAALCVASAVALAAGTTVFGTIQNVDADQGRLTLRAKEDKIVELQAPAELLSGLQTGDAVEVKVSGQKASNSNFGSQDVSSLGLSLRASLASSLSPLIMKSIR